jgi:hypothetical protein
MTQSRDLAHDTSAEQTAPAEKNHSGRYVKVLATLLPAGAFGMSTALAATTHTDVATTGPHANVAAPDTATRGGADVAEQLRAIREGVSTVAGAAAADQKVAWWWFRNFWPNFRNYWPNWGNYWRNW